MARLAETKAAWERAQAEAQRAQAEAVEDLLGSGLQPDEVAELLGISNRELRSLRGTTPALADEGERADERVGERPDERLGGTRSAKHASRGAEPWRQHAASAPSSGSGDAREVRECR